MPSGGAYEDTSNRNPFSPQSFPTNKSINTEVPKVPGIPDSVQTLSRLLFHALNPAAYQYPH